MEPEAVGRILDQLFPQLPALMVTSREAEGGPPLLTTAEIDAAVDRVCTKFRKAPGLDGIPIVCGPSYIGLIQGYETRSST